MNHKIFLFIGFIGALFAIYYPFISYLKGILAARRLFIINSTASLKKNLQFAELDKSKSYESYLEDKDKSEDWLTEAQKSYLVYYQNKKKIHESCVAEEIEKKNQSIIAKEREKKIKLLYMSMDMMKAKVKSDSKSISLTVDFVKWIENL